VFVIKTFDLLMVLVFQWRENMVKSFLFVAYHGEAPSTGLLNSLNYQKICVINVKMCVNLAHMFIAHKSAVNNRQ
jgi:hypothetical protein